MSAIMEIKWRIFRSLMWKNFLIRRRHYKQIIFFQILLPLCIFLLLQKARSPRWYSSEEDSVKYYPLETKEELLKDLEDFRLYYAPKNNFTEALIGKTIKCLSLQPDNVTAFISEEAMLKNYSYEYGLYNYDVKIIGLIFEDTYDPRKNLEYIVRSSYGTPGDVLGGVFQGFGHYYLSYCFKKHVPYVQTQMCIDESFINMSVPNSNFTRKVTLQRFPESDKVKLNQNEEITRFFFPASAVVLFLITVVTEASFSASEKYKGVNILMRLSGIQFHENLLSWLIAGILQGIFFSTLMIIVMTQAFGNPILLFGNSFIIWLFLVFHFSHLTAFGMHIASYFSGSLKMEIVIFILYVGSSMFQADLIDSYMFVLIPYLGIIFPNVLLYRMFEEMNNYETIALGIQWSSLFQVSDTSYTSAGSIGVLMIFTILGTVLHFSACLYVHIVFPGKFGLKHHPLYLFQREKNNYKELDEELDEYNYDNESGKPFEKVPKGSFTPGVQIRNVKKTYTTFLFNKKEIEALHGISLDVYKGQITTLLGRNGSGKSTLMSILAGIYEPNDGLVFIDGKANSDFFRYFSTDLSFCPQENMFFPFLTVIEQIEFFGKLNHVNKSEDELRMLSFNVEKLLRRLKLYEKRNSFPKELSVSEQRSLCLGMSLITDAKILILDEPTYGMDSESKRNTWKMLLEIKSDKTIVISTKDPEEADVLSDKIAILHLGMLKGYGTSTFLKKFYGMGNIEITLSVTTWCNTESIRQELGVENELLKIEDETMILCAPWNDRLAEALDKLENDRRELGITAIRVSLITLEQVVLKITKKIEDMDLSRPFVNPAYKLKDRELLLQTIFALVLKNFTFIRRNICIFLIMISLPLMSSLFMIMNFSSLNEVQQSRYLTLDIYNEPQVMFATNNRTYSQRTKSYIKRLRGYATEVNSSTNLNDALVKFSEKDIAAYRYNLITAIEFNTTQESVNANALYSGTASFSMPIGINILSNVLLDTLTGDDDHRIGISDHPFPQLRVMSSSDLFGLGLLFISFLFPAIAIFGLYPTEEISSGMKHLQIMTGISPLTYWAVQFAVDFIIFMVLIVSCLIGLSFMDHAVNFQLYTSTELGIMTMLLILLGVNILPISYIFSYAKMSRSNVIFVLGLLPLLLLSIEGFFWMIEFESSHYYSRETDTYERRSSGFLNFREVQKRIFQLIPHVSFFHSQVSFLTTGVGNAHCRYLVQHDIADHFFDDYCEELECSKGSCKKHVPYFGKSKPMFAQAQIVLEECVTYLCLTPFLYFAILAAIEYKYPQKLLARLFKKKTILINDEIDDTVKEEKYTVGFEVNKLKAESASKKANKLVTETRHESDNAFLANELSKSYKSKSIIKEVTFSVKSGECFGLLGVNNVGKSTIFKIITGDELPDTGDIFLRGCGLFFDRKEYLTQIGYCPQRNALIDSLSARDHLRLFAQIRGLPQNQVNLEVEEWIKRLNLTECASEPCNTYNSGSKRCLNIAIAFIGNPDLILLDEPTVGIDPASRKSVWNLLKSFARTGQSIILTSHSMEECEALCNRLAVLAKGQLVCIGSSEELKKRFGTGYNILIELTSERSEAHKLAIKSDIENSISCEIQDEHLENICYFVKNSETSWRTLYDLMKRLKYKYPCIVDFTILTATLEQIFLRFIKLKGD